jgi:hypothetical protein
MFFNLQKKHINWKVAAHMCEILRGRMLQKRKRSPYKFEDQETSEITLLFLSR